MAGDWIKMRGNLWDDPRVSKLCDLTDCGEAQIIGGLYWLWATADQHTEDGIMPGLSLRQVDRKTGIAGFGEALCIIGWLADHPEGLRICKFEEHNGTSAKRRCSDAQRKANGRTVSASDADKTQTDGGQDEDEKRRLAELEKEKRREEVKPLAPIGACPQAELDDPKTGDQVIPQDPKPYELPDCPHQELVALYHEVLPTLRRCEILNDTRRGYARQRWREVCEPLKLSRAEGLEWWRGYFGQVGQSMFLTGRGPPDRSTGRAFSADFEWLVRPTNFAKVVEGKYADGARR